MKSKISETDIAHTGLRCRLNNRTVVNNPPVPPSQQKKVQEQSTTCALGTYSGGKGRPTGRHQHWSQIRTTCWLAISPSPCCYVTLYSFVQTQCFSKPLRSDMSRGLYNRFWAVRNCATVITKNRWSDKHVFVAKRAGGFESTCLTLHFCTDGFVMIYFPIWRARNFCGVIFC